MSQLENGNTFVLEPTKQESIVENNLEIEKIDTIKHKKSTHCESDEPNDNKSVEISELEAKIIRQIEYYFSDANLRRDKFLLEQISKDSEGWVSFNVILKFKRLAELNTDIKTIVNALTKSDEGLIEISDDKMKIRRHSERPILEYNEEIRKELSSRTAYVKGFPLNCEMSELIDFFRPFKKVSNIIMRKYVDKLTKCYKFKGSVFVTFDKKEQCEEFIGKEKMQYKRNDLIRKWQEKYLEEKKKEREESAARKMSKKVKKENKIELPKGTVLHFEGSNENTTREVIKEALTSLNIEVAFIEYTKGEKSGYIRLANENAAKKLIDKLDDNTLKVDSVELTLRILAEDEEKLFLDKVVSQMKSKRSYQCKNKGRKRKMSENEAEPPAKK